MDSVHTSMDRGRASPPWTIDMGRRWTHRRLSVWLHELSSGCRDRSRRERDMWGTHFGPKRKTSGIELAECRRSFSGVVLHSESGEEGGGGKRGEERRDQGCLL
jgi:hypothetical protein